MRRRLALALCGTLALALVVAGLGTLLIAQARAARTTEAELVRQVVILRDEIENQVGDIARPNGLATRLATIRRILRLDAVTVVLIRPDGTIAPGLPEPLRIEDLPLERLRAGDVVSGTRGPTAFAAVAQRLNAGTFAVVATRTVNTGLDAALRWLGLGAALTLTTGIVVAAVLSRRLAQPILQADAVARRIAAGELSARVTDLPARRDDELADLVRNVNAMADALERAKGLEQQFLLSVSHDLRTPLTSIRGFADAISDGTARDPVRAASVIGREARRLERLVGDLLDLAKLDARAFRLDRRPTDLRQLADEVAAGIATPGVQVHPPAPGPTVWVDVDPDRMAQVVANLLGNAGKYAAGHVTVTVDAHGGTARLVVDDDGPGIDPTDLPRVFERLYTARSGPARVENGSGLGLAIVRELVEAMGGTVDAQRAPGGGARLVVSLATIPPPLPPADPAGRAPSP